MYEAVSLEEDMMNGHVKSSQPSVSFFFFLIALLNPFGF